MRLKLYEAQSVGEAMARIRAELGPEALILSSRRIRGGVEVTAGFEPPEDAAPAGVADPATLHALGWHGLPTDLAETLAARGLQSGLERTLHFAPTPLGPESPPLLLVGPPGAGKTLTAARLATRLVMSGVRPMVVTADGKRAGAAEQLAAYTRLLRIDLLVASQPAVLARAISGRQAGAPALIDASGSDPFDAAHAEELRALAAIAGATVALVLPAGLDVAEARDLARAYADLGATLLVGTRLDLARRVGAVVVAAHAGQLALVEAGIGPGAADGLTPMSAALLAARLQACPKREVRS
jgi:flagellar biosynthesis protein FlhF